MSRIAAIQMATGPNTSANLLEAQRHIKRAAEDGAALVVLPENFAFMGSRESDVIEHREQDGDGPIQAFLAEQAERNGVWIVGGTVPMAAGDDKARAASLLFDAKGQRVARYDKIHLFDVRLEESDETYNESACYEHGSSIVVVDTPFGRMGMAVCYDLRFPELFRGMLNQQVDFIVLPAAFTAITGRAHWEPLVRARAIENQCYFVAAAQGGYHASGRETWGHTMIVDPWGVVLDELPRGAGVVSAELDRERLAALRRSFPVLNHRRLACQIG